VPTKNKLVSKLNPNDLIKKSSITQDTQYVSEINFSNFSLHAKLEKAIADKGYVRPTEIQERSIPQLMSGKNMVGIAATGTGKTGAFLIPIIHQILENSAQSALVVVPTRELAQQVLEEFTSLTKGMQFQSSCFIGGTNMSKDLANSRRKHQFIVATPGRLMDLVKRGALQIKGTSILVLDEFDRMLDMGFINDVRKIANAVSGRKQTMLFSATVDKSQESLIREFVQNPIRVNVTKGNNSSDHVEQGIIKVSSSENKFDVLLEMLNKASFEKVILFAETKRTADKISKQLCNSGLRSDVIHGNKSQNYRTKAIQLFKAGKTQILVATDVAARGIDVDNVSHVINYQMPLTMDSYIHRIGRTGRAGKPGMAYTFIN
jgi:ATP-dependent RNA helicase RhlE